MVKVRIPTPLKKLTNNQAEIHVEGRTIIEIINNFDKGYPGIKERIVDENNEIRRFVNIYLNGEDVRFLDEKETEVKDGDEISIIPAVAGG